MTYTKRKPVPPENGNALVQIRFLTRDAPWDVGDLALLGKAQARRLIAAGVAVEVGRKAEE